MDQCKPHVTPEIYRQFIKDMADQMQDEYFLRQIYSIMLRHIKRTERS